jgi:EAL domain-containing protein (putative c-di-GMP-specific phosphodiesterase class I)
MEQEPTDLSRLLRSAERRVERWQVHLPPKGKVIYDPAAAQRRAPRNTAVDMTPQPIVSSPPIASLSTRFDNTQGVQFLYQPIWYAPKGVVIGYRCQLNFLTPAECIPSEVLVADGGVPDAALKVDRLILQKGLTDLAQLLASGQKAIVICPLHAATFAAASAWRQFEQIAYGLTAEMRSLLMFEILDAAAVGADLQLVSTVHDLSRYARQVMARVPLQTLGFGNFRENGFSALSTSLSELLHDEADIIRMIRRFCGGAKELGLLTVLNDASSTSILIAAAAHGADYIGGSAVAKDVSQPTGVTPFDLLDVYRPRLG